MLGKGNMKTLCHIGLSHHTRNHIERSDDVHRSARVGGFRLAASRLEMLVDLVPVNDIEKGSDVLRPPVLVFQVVSVLPDIDPQDRGFSLADRAILVRCGYDFQLSLVYRHPSPSASEDKSCGVREVLLDLVEAAMLLNRWRQKRGRRGQHLF